MAEIRVKAVLKELHIAPRKVRLIADAIRGMHIRRALAELDTMTKRGALPITKLINSAIANAESKKMNTGKLIIKSIVVNEGRVFKRVVPRARGRATLVQKKTSHVILELVEKEDAVPPAFVIPEKPKKVKSPRGETTRKPRKQKTEDEMKKKKREKTRGGFMKKVFRRKAV